MKTFLNNWTGIAITGIIAGVFLFLVSVSYELIYIDLSWIQWFLEPAGEIPIWVLLCLYLILLVKGLGK